MSLEHRLECQILISYALIHSCESNQSVRVATKLRIALELNRLLINNNVVKI